MGPPASTAALPPTSSGDHGYDGILASGNTAESGASKSTSTATPTPSRRNVRNLSLGLPPAPSIAHTQSSSSYSSFAESARILSPHPPTPRLGAHPLQTIPSSRPGTPSLLAPRTPGLGLVPLTPNAPAGVVFSPNTPLFSPNGLPPTSPNPAPTKASKLKSQLTSFLPVSKHTYFHAKIDVEQLSSVPFVGGQFGVRWKFKSVHRHSGNHHPQEEEDGHGLWGRARPKTPSSKDKGKGRDHDGREVDEFGYHPSQQSSVGSTATASSTDTTSIATSHSSSFTSGTTSTTWSSTSMASVQSSSSVATKMTSATTTPSTNLSRNFYSPYSSVGGSTSPSSREAQYGPSQYLFVSPEGSTGISPGANSSNSADASTSLLLSPNAQRAFSSNAAMSPMSPNFNVLSPAGTVSQGNYGSVANHPGVNHPGSHLPHSGNGGAGQIGTLSAARGMTRYMPLKDHSVAFNFPLEAIVKMDVTRSGTNSEATTPPDPTGGLNPNDPHSSSSTSVPSAIQPSRKPNLQPSPLKLVVMQRVDGADPSSVPQNPRLGVLSINLAEYVGKGKVERRFLLKESRVNATLKLSIEVTYVSGYQGYVAPPLQKTEILGGIEGFLKEHDHLLSKKKTSTMGGGLGGREPGAPKSRAKAAGVGDLSDVDGGDDAAGQEFEVDLLRRDFLEREKDRIGQGLVANVVLADVGVNSLAVGLGAIDAAAQSGWEEAQAGTTVPGNAGLSPRSSADPYALPSESESESEYGSQLQSEGVRGVPVRQMTEEVLGRKRWKEDLRAKRREERSKKLMLNLSESETDESMFESADEEFSVEGVREPSEKVVTVVEKSVPQAHIRVAAFDVQRLPLSYGPKTTESLIEALFNPGPTTEASDEDPFVMYVSPAELRERQLLEIEYRREVDMQAMQQAKAKAGQERALLEQHSNHWYKPRRRDTEDSSAAGHGGGLRMKMKRTVKRGETMDSASTSTTSGSGSGGSPGVPLTSIRSPGEDTIVGVRTGDDEPDVMSPATITAGRPGPQRFSGLGISVDGANAGDRDATLGKSGGTAAVGNFLHNYYRAKKDKVKDKAAEARKVWEARNDTNQVLDGVYVDQEPQQMYGQLAHGCGPVSGGHQRSATGDTMSSNASSSSLSSLSLGSQSASGHGHGNPHVMPGPKSGVGSGDATMGVGLGSVRSRQPDLSVPPGRMDRMGIVKGVPVAIGEDDAAGLGSKLKGWWKGSQR